MRKLGEGRHAEVLLQADGSAVKLLRDPAHAQELDREEAALSALRGAGPPAPAVLGRVTIDGRPGLAMERARGPDLLARLPRRPWLLPRAAKLMARLHAAMHETAAPASLPPVRDGLRALLRAAAAAPPGVAERALALLDELPDGDRLCHGDFHLANVLGTFDAPVVIDWPEARRGDPLADVARTVLLHRVAALPPGTPLLSRALVPLGRGLLVRGYLAEYRRLRPVDGGLLARWLFVVAAARYGEGIVAEHPALARLLGA